MEPPKGTTNGGSGFFKRWDDNSNHVDWALYERLSSSLLLSLLGYGLQVAASLLGFHWVWRGSPVSSCLPEWQPKGESLNLSASGRLQGSADLQKTLGRKAFLTVA